MNRCLKSPARQALSLGSAALLALLPALASAQLATDPFQRRIPEQARRGVLKVAAPPDVLLNGQPARLSPGSRIRTEANLIVPPHQLIGQELQVHYTREGQGLVHEVWILTPAEQAQQRAAKGDLEQRSFRPDPVPN
jgi:hypothetical protein